MLDSPRLAIQVKGLRKNYGPTTVLSGIDIDIREGEFLTLLGPSGSGKSTLLMMLAGFTDPSGGSILIDGQDVTALPAHKRNLGVVFQSYALFPHMSVAENVAYPLKVRGVDRAERERRVVAALEMVRLGHLTDRRIQQLSGGQKQRVALARAIVFEPKVILMDEPLSALDKKLREEMQVELRDLHERLNMTTIYVTHDQREALTMSDRIAVMQHGRMLQIDSPQAIYRAPSDSFVAEFMGDTTLLPLVFANGRYELNGRAIRFEGTPDPVRKQFLVFRPERLRLIGDMAPDNENVLDGKLSHVVYLGDALLAIVDIGKDRRISVKVELSASGDLPGPGGSVKVGLSVAETQLVPECVV